MNKIYNIDVYYNGDDNTLEDILYHELHHAYEDYNRYKNGKPSLSTLFDDIYFKSSSQLNSNQYGTKIVSRLLYFLNSTERNAYLSELTPQIKRIINKNNYSVDNLDIDKFIEEFKHTDIWKHYFELGQLISDYSNDKLKDYEIDNITNKFNEIANTNLYKNEIVKILKIKFKKFKNKFEQIVSKLIKNELKVTIKELAIITNYLNF